MSYQHFKVDLQNKIAHVAFNRPDKANALNMEAWQEMQAIFDDLSTNPEARVVVLSGEGKHFCAGIDLELLMSVAGFQQVTCGGRRSEKIRDLVKNCKAVLMP